MKSFLESQCAIDKEIILEKIALYLETRKGLSFLKKHFEAVKDFFNGESYKMILEKYDSLNRASLSKAIFEIRKLIKNQDFGYY